MSKAFEELKCAFAAYQVSEIGSRGLALTCSNYLPDLLREYEELEAEVKVLRATERQSEAKIIRLENRHVVYRAPKPELEKEVTS